eukprot:comp11430_c0_seq1/m.5842 comp11430_c0_seq1/g.5842  ORF comp11430_c0_seq1/g.5842 comp11430_c0_seq1/m.5842 type:complete len:104 (-) comp11430_c0_seq1:645-956(-)
MVLTGVTLATKQPERPSLPLGLQPDPIVRGCTPNVALFFRTVLGPPHTLQQTVWVAKQPAQIECVVQEKDAGVGEGHGREERDADVGKFLCTRAILASAHLVG